MNPFGIGSRSGIPRKVSSIPYIPGKLKTKIINLFPFAYPLGVPTDVGRYAQDGVGIYRTYEKGVVYRHPSTGENRIYYGPVFDKWVELGAETGALGYPIDESGLKNALGMSKGYFQYGTISAVTTGVGEFQVYAQNTALISIPVLYKGRNREAAIKKLIDYLLVTKPALAGLSELFKNDERQAIIQAVNKTYKYSVQGPDESDIDEDGGLLLLSKFPIEESRSTIFRLAIGPDFLANKGVLYARVKPDHSSTPIDVYLSHTQDGDVLDGAGIAFTFAQLDQMRSFFEATRNPMSPAILMGDLNIDLNDPVKNNLFKQKLAFDFDLWDHCGEKSKYPHGITCDYFRTFESDSVPAAVEDPRRQQNGRRLDAILAWKGMDLWPRYPKTEIVMNQSDQGIDMSDHYGLLATIKGADIFEVDIARTIHKVTVGHHKIHCFKTTSGGGADSVYFYLHLMAANLQELVRVSGVRDVDTAEIHDFQSPVVLTIPGDPGAHLQITVNGAEEDDWLLDRTDDPLGIATITLSRREMLGHYGQTFYRTLPMLYGDGGEYAISIWIKVE